MNVQIDFNVKISCFMRALTPSGQLNSTRDPYACKPITQLLSLSFSCIIHIYYIYCIYDAYSSPWISFKLDSCVPLILQRQWQQLRVRVAKEPRTPKRKEGRRGISRRRKSYSLLQSTQLNALILKHRGIKRVKRLKIALFSKRDTIYYYF